MCKLLCALIYINLCWLIEAYGVIFNCTQTPTFANTDANLYCRRPETHFGNVFSLCYRHGNQLKSADDAYCMPATLDSYQLKLSPIFVNSMPSHRIRCTTYYSECVHCETGALVDGDFRMENVKRYLQRNVQQGDKDIVPYIVYSFETCLANSA